MQKLKSNGIPDRHLKAWPLRWWPFFTPGGLTVTNQKLLANALEVKVDEFYVDSELPVPRNVLLAEILDTLEKLDQPFQLHILRVAQDLVALTHPKSE